MTIALNLNIFKVKQDYLAYSIVHSVWKLCFLVGLLIRNENWEPNSNELGTCFIFVPTLETRTGPEPPTVIFEDSHNSYLAKAIAQWGKIHFDWAFII